jgi:hypothetical protein
MSQLDSQYARMNDGSNPPKQRGCLFYGCLSLAIIGLLMIVGILVVGYFAKRAINRLIADYTDTTPAPIQKVEYPPEQLEALRARLKGFKEAMDRGGAPAELVLNAEDLNALITAEKNLSGKVFVQIDEGKIKGNISLPLEDLGPLKLKGRYLNGTGVFKVKLENGFLDVTLDTLEVKGKSLPDPFLRELKKQNLAKDATNDPEARDTIEKLQSIQVKDGQVILKSSGKTPATQERAPPPNP